MKALITIGLVIFAIAAAAATAAAVPRAWENLAEDEVIAFIQAATGGNVRVEGSTSIALLPTPSFTLEQVEFGNAEGQPSLSASSVRVSLRTLPLLSGRFEPATITLSDAEIRLDWQADEDPGTMLSDLLRYSQHPLVAEAHTRGVDAILLRGGSAWLTDRRLGQTEEITAIDMQLVMGANQAPLRLDGSLRWGHQAIELSASLKNPSDLFNSAGSEGQLTIAATPTTQAADASKTPDAAGGAETVPTASAMASPPNPAVRAIGPFRMAGVFKLSDGVITLEDAAIEAPGARASGSVILDLAGARPLLSGILEFNTFDLGPYLSSLMPLMSYGDLREVSLAPAWLRDVEIDLTARVPEVYFGPLDFSQPTMRVHLTSGRTTLTLLETGLAGGQIRGRLAMLPAGSGTSIRFTGNVEHVSAGEIGRALWPTSASLPVGQDQPPEGTLYATIALEGRGTTLGAALDTLDGWAVAVARDGSLGGADVVSTLQRLTAGTVLPGSGEPFMPAAGRTSFSTFIASATVRDGIVHLPLARFEGDGFEVSLSGQARLVDGRLEAEGTASLDASQMRDQYTPGVQLPFGVGGTAREPVFAPGIPRIGGHSAPLFAAHEGQTIPIALDGPVASDPAHSAQGLTSVFGGGPNGIGDPQH